MLFVHFNHRRIYTVTQSQHCRNNKQQLNAQCLPDPAAEQGNENGDHMVDGNTCGNGGLDFILIVGQGLHIVVGGHGTQRDDSVKNIVYAADDECHILGEQMVGETVEEADNDEDHSICHHDRLVSQLVDDAAYDGRGKEAGNCGQGKQEADHSGIGTIEKDQHIRAKGEEHLLTGAVEHLQHIILFVFLVEVETTLIMIGLAFTCDLKTAQSAGACQNRSHTEE